MIKLVTVALGLVSLSHVIVLATADETSTCNGCQNGGVLTENSDGTGLYCQCTDEYEGDFCAERKATCDSCQNGGVLTVKSDGTGLYCQCTEKYTGKFCEKLRECPPGFEYASTAGKCYKFVTDKANYTNARQECPNHAAGAQLVVIENKEQDDAVLAYLKSHEPELTSKNCKDNGVSEIMIGGQRPTPVCKAGDPDNFVWKHNDGTSTPLTYKHWNSGEPNCYLSRENCLFLVKFTNWNDEKCDASWCYVCETNY